MEFDKKQLVPGLYRTARLMRTIEKMEFEFKYLLVTGTKAQIVSMEVSLGKYYAILMKEVVKSNLQSIIEVDDSYQITINKEKWNRKS